MKTELLYKSVDKLLNQMLKEVFGIDYKLSVDEKSTELYEMPMFRLHILVDPEKYHWSGEIYDPEYIKNVDYVEDYLDKVVKYLGLTHENFSSIDIKFNSEKAKEYYQRILPKIPRVWKIFQEGMIEKVQIPDLKSVEVVKRVNNDYDLKFHLDRSNLSKNKFELIVYNHIMPMFFVYAGNHGIPMDSHYIEFV